MVQPRLCAGLAPRTESGFESQNAITYGGDESYGPSRAAIHRNALTGSRGTDGHPWPPFPARMGAMKAILQATLAAIVSGILVGVLLKKKVAGATRSSST